MSDIAILRQLLVLSDVRPLFDYCRHQIAVSLCRLRDAKRICLGGVLFGKGELPVAQQ
jgi:hypothetical protein